jgi:serine/threonine protein kinase
VESTADGPREVFFSEVNSDDFNLPLNKPDYILHSCMIDSVGIRAVGLPVGQGAMQAPRMALDPSREGPTRIGGYPILGVLGRGGMGTVYLAEDTRLKRRVAIKMLPGDDAWSGEPLARFRREAQILANLSHPNIAVVYSLEDDVRGHFISMEYVTGQTLAQWIDQKPSDLSPVYRICRQIAAALDAAHRQDVVHRDLKPSNVMVTPRDDVKVLDFGLAKVMTNRGSGPDSGHWTRSGYSVGTPGYMSPEQLLGHDVDSKSDVWSFGCCLYECLSGRMAFPGKTPAERAAATLYKDPDLAALGSVPEAITDLLVQALERDPAKRLPALSLAIDMIDAVGAIR